MKGESGHSNLAHNCCMQIKYICIIDIRTSLIVGVVWYRFRSAIRPNAIRLISTRSFPTTPTTSWLAGCCCYCFSLVIVIVNVFESVRRFGCAHQNLINYYIISCFVHEIYFTCCSMNCFQTSQFSSFSQSSFFLLLSFRWLLLFSAFSHSYWTLFHCHCCCIRKIMNSRESQLRPITIIIRFDI